ncbi:molybdopterin binding aldehyde oxidase/xanthine dehydrogenase [Thamnocephalis sphaerospora]|uniref:xanthine dehydrogenase n=1 Tax=Thamnocephalis sphaerospora TaxID=78915 RepID=A0A4P9XTG1_9FUNG|nr:molybdopterin binding aldehyde oxidase/xanthine dehydrogenase [Thamnocephalis sphaerospora]|eukprot:RKP08720.1 molybdopterin binding aldehyde oxidase/xanthine dehydrogenase [Thamnocephalis sphaerospora]
MPALPASTLLFYVNGTRVELSHPDPDLTLLQYLRHIGLRGTKLGCGEGGCGAHVPVNACLAPLCAMDGKHVVTVEGIGRSSKPHPVQERIAQMHGSQCGFCTPGIVMSLYTLLRNNPNPSEETIEETFDGNLCRCTGYRPILDAAKTVCTTKRCNRAMTYFNAQYDPTQEILFPPALIQYAQSTLGVGARRSLVFAGKRTAWHRPTTLQELLQLKKTHPEAKLIAGNTEIGIEVKFKHMHYPVLVQVSDLPDLCGVSVDDEGVTLGAGATLQRIQDFLASQVLTQDHERTEALRAMLSNLKWFAGRQIRSVGTLAGNIATASPISDLNPVLIAAGAVLGVASASKGSRDIPMSKFFLGYRKTALGPDEVIVSVRLPFTKPGEYVRAYKQARRKDDDIAIVNAAMRVRIERTAEAHRIVESTIAYGGMGPTTVIARDTGASLLGIQLGDQAAFDRTTDVLLQKELPLQASTPGGMPEYRMSLAASFLFRFWCDICFHHGVCPAEDVSCVEEITRGLSRGVQDYSNDSDNKYVGQPMAHMSALKQVTGEAVYTDDIPPVQGELYVSFVASTKAHARILSVDASAATNVAGVVAYFSAADIPGTNRWGPVIHDELIFAEDEVVYVGQPIGIIVAQDQPTAQRAARLVHVEYEDLPHVLTIEDAIATESFFEAHRTLERGEYRMGGQEHFYLETQGSIVVPKGEDGEMEIMSCTQNPNETQLIVSKVLGLPSSRIVCRVKRLGGGFGGKETRSIPVAAALAVAAHHLGRPARYMLDRDEDMAISGQRHPFLGRWRVGVTAAGKITALDLQLFSNGGCSLDLSLAVMERAILHSDNSYYIPNCRIVGRICRTNTPSNTAGLLIAEAWVHEVAEKLGMPVHKFQELNLYKEGQLTHFNQKLVDWNVPLIWKQLMESSEFAHRRANVDAFNEQTRWKKRGLSILPTKFGISFTALHLNQAGALVHIYTDGSILLTHGGTEMGQGLHTKMIQVCAECLGVPIEAVHISETATNTVANASATAASASTNICVNALTHTVHLNGMAIKDACDQLNARLKPYRNSHPDASFAEIVQKAYFDRVNLSANGFYKTPDIGYDWQNNTGQMFFYFTQGAAVSEVEVDVLTGDHTVLRTDLMMDVGKSLNYALDVGQIEGALMQGIGWCTLEESMCFPSGQMFTRGPGTYKLPGFRDIPQDMRIHILKNGTYTHLKTIKSSKGIGEPPLFLGATVLFAIRDALLSARRDAGNTGPLTLQSPATAERIRLACADKLRLASRVHTAASDRPWVVAP